MSAEASRQTPSHPHPLSAPSTLIAESLLYFYLPPHLLFHIRECIPALDLLRNATVSKWFLRRWAGMEVQEETFHKRDNRRKRLIQSLRAALELEIGRQEEIIGEILERCGILESTNNGIVSGFFEPMRSLVAEEMLSVQEVIMQMRQIIYGLEAQRQLQHASPSLDTFKHLLLAQLWNTCALKEAKYQEEIGMQKIGGFPREAFLSYWMKEDHIKALFSPRWREAELNAMLLGDAERVQEAERRWTAEEVHGLAPFQLMAITDKFYNYTLEQVRDARFTQSHTEVLQWGYVDFDLQEEPLADFSEQEVLGRLLGVWRAGGDTPIDQITPETWRHAATRVWEVGEYPGLYERSSHLQTAARYSAYLFTAILKVCQFSPEELVAVLQRSPRLQNSWTCKAHPPFFTLLKRGLNRSPAGSDWRNIDTLMDLQVRLSPENWEGLLMTQILFKPASSLDQKEEEWRSPLAHVVIEKDLPLLTYLFSKFEPAKLRALLETLIYTHCSIQVLPHQHLHPAVAIVSFFRLLRTDIKVRSEGGVMQEREEAVLRLVLPLFMISGMTKEAIEKAVAHALRILSNIPLESETAEAKLQHSLLKMFFVSEMRDEMLKTLNTVEATKTEIAKAEANAVCMLERLPLALQNAAAAVESTEEKGELAITAAGQSFFNNKQTYAPPPKRQKVIAQSPAKVSINPQ